MKQSFLLLIALPFSVFAQAPDKPVELVLGKVSLSLGTNVLEDGSQTDFSLGYRYTPSTGGEIRFRYIKQSYNDDLYDLEESLLANDELTFETFLLPFRYHFFNDSTLSFNAAAGLYYEYNTLKQHGYFNMSALAPDNLNIYRNDFSLHLLGPLAEAGLHLRTQPVDIKLKAGIAPVFYLRREQSVQIKPYMGAAFFDHSQDTGGSPYFYGEVDGIFFKFLSLSLLYEYARINYDVIGADENKNWITPENELVTHSLKAEVSVLLSFGGGLYLQAGYGHSFDTIILNSSTPVEEDSNYVIIGTKKLFF
jgi:hypothetical protein